jgi:MscS family membrane protein
MKMKWERVYRGLLAMLVLAVLWTAWAGAQPSTTGKDTNQSVRPASTNQTNVIGAEVPDAPVAGAAAKKSKLLDQRVTFGLDQLEFLQPELFGNPLWKYVASLVYILLALYASKLIDWLFQVWLKRWIGRVAGPGAKFDELWIGLVHGPIKVVCFVVLLHIGLDLFSWPIWVAKYISVGLKLLVAGSLTYLALKFVDLALSYWKIRATSEADKSFNEQLYRMVRTVSRAFTLLVAILLTSQNLGLNITSILASLSIGGLAVGLAAQDTLANLFGAVAVYLDKPFQVGDEIQIDSNVGGVVERIGMRSTRVRNPEGFLITVPNKTMASATIINVARRPTIKTVMNIGLAYDTSAEKLKRALAILKEVFRSHPMTHDLVISFNKFTDSALNIQVVHWWKNTDYQAYVAGMQEMNLAIKQRFDQEGLSFASPTQTFYLKQDAVPSTAAAAQPGK